MLFDELSLVLLDLERVSFRKSVLYVDCLAAFPYCRSSRALLPRSAVSSVQQSWRILGSLVKK